MSWLKNFWDSIHTTIKLIFALIVAIFFVVWEYNIVTFWILIFSLIVLFSVIIF